MIRGQRSCGVVDGQSPVSVDRKCADLTVVRRHHRQVRTVFAGQAGDRARSCPAAQQQVQRVVGAGGVDDVGGRHRGQCRNRRPARVERGRGRRCGDITADLGLMAGVLCGGVDDREALPRARAAVQVQTCDFRPRRAPASSKFLASGRCHLVDSDRPKSPAWSVHQCVRRRPASASSAATPSGRNLQDTSVSISSPSAKSTVRSSTPTRTC